MAYDIKEDHFSVFALFWWMRYAEKQSDGENFLLHVDVDGPKLVIFMNTVFMNNFSISKKLSHNDAYISQKNPDKFQFELSKIFARKPLKKIRRNVVSKFARLAVAKLVMKG